MKKLLSLLAALFCICSSWAQKPVASKSVGFAVSSPVKDFGAARVEPGKTTSRKFVDENEGINKSNEKRVKEIVPGLGGNTGGKIQSSINYSKGLAAAPLISFEGNSSADNTAAYGSSVYPPDVNGDVGPNHYVQTTNLLVGIFSKTTGALVVPKFKMSTLFAPLGAPFSTTDNGDPIVLYDQLADRWLISQFLFTNISGGVYYQVIAISQTGDPTGAYYLYAFLMPNNKLNDYPHFGVWPDGYYMTDNQFTNGGPFSGAGAFAFDRVKMLKGDPTAGFIYFDQEASCPSCGGQLPTDLDGFVAPPIGTPNLFMEFRADEYGDPYDGLRIFAFHADFANPANSTFTRVGASDLPLATFDARNPSGRRDIEQPPPSNATTMLDGINDRLMFRLACRILPGGVQSYVGNFTVNVSGVNPTTPATYQAGIKWFELRRSAGGTMSVNDEGIYAPGAGNGATGRNIWMAGIAQDGEGNLGLGFSASSTTIFPSVLYTGRLATDPAGTMGHGEGTIVDGTGVQRGTGNRWGDYSSMSVDPVDDGTFWYTQEYYSAASQASSVAGWLTRVGSFKINPGYVMADRGTISGTITDCTTGAPIANAIVTTPDGFFTATNAAGQYSMLVGSGSYTVTITGQDGYTVCTTNNVTVSSGEIAQVDCCLTQAVAPGIVGANQTICYGGNPTAFTEIAAATGIGPFTYQWQKNTTGCSFNFTNIPGATGISYDAPAGLLETTYYRRVAFATVSGATASANSNCITVAVTNASRTLVFNGVIGAGDPQQTGRVARNGIVSTCAAPKASVGLNDVVLKRYDSYTLVNPTPFPFCSTISLTSTCGTNIFHAAYLNSFNPANVLVNYLGDPGNSSAGTSVFSVTVPANGTLVVVVHEIAASGCGGYTLSVEMPNPIVTLTSAEGTDAQTICSNTPIENITYNAPGATSVVVSGLPENVSGNLLGNTLTISGTPAAAGVYNYTALFMPGGCTTGSITVNGNPTFTAPIVTALPNVQYSDPIVPVTISVTDDGPGSALTASTQYKLGAGAFTAGLPPDLTLVVDATTANSRSWTLSGIANLPLGTYTIRVTVSDGLCESYVDLSFTVVCEDARTYYTGATYASTSGASSSNATVTLSATIRDITAEPGEAAFDDYAGDIRKATVTFINRDNNSIIAANVPVGLVNPADLTTGTATYNWNTNISGDASQFTIGIIVNNYYCRNSSDDNTIITVSKPLTEYFISGGGYLVLTNSAGTKAGKTGSKNNFGFNVKFNKSGKNLQGNINTIVRKMEAGVMRVYQIKGNAMTSLAVNENCPKSATFNGRANIKDITDPLNPLSLEGNASLQVVMTDMGEPGSSDKIAITVWDRDGGLWFASNWNGTATAEQTLGGGNLKVHGGAACNDNPAGPGMITEAVSPKVTIADESAFKAVAFPNPSKDGFTIQVVSNSNEPFVVRLVDAAGSVKEVSRRMVKTSILKMGSGLGSGVYFAEVTQGSNKQILKLIKY